MAVLFNRGDKLTRVIVERTATVRDLKRALRGAVELELERQCRRRLISWRYVWRTNWLCFEGRQLTDDNARLADFGLTNRAEVRFVPRIRAKRGQRDKKGGQVQT
ncbi:U11/U12 small nuclear ribonucleoprotein 25 kDa protein-like [Pollicipes pollicipes]|uniref:U11/U12 small nuclear ribonucleoprotein 25 kDa protein-like n=1 Tax=Pollicipes pollicipes TaxID=41117 RepID=UPI00188532D0|nr:U11/U12 small nuclear ribonucleoprotein 25 kDa protein-like [Pollicipes pollicipes]